jgi:NADH-quinone oxidoreductase subunit J
MRNGELRMANSENRTLCASRRRAVAGKGSIAALNPSHFNANPQPLLRVNRLLLILIGALSTASVAHAAETPSTQRIGVTDAAPAGGLLDALLFYSVAGPLVIAAIGICFSKNIVRMAVWLFVALSFVSILYFMLAANFLGALQLIVYVGGTLVLLVFGVMLTSKSPWVKFATPKIELAVAAIVCLALFGSLAIVLAGTAWKQAPSVVPGVAMAEFGKRLITTYLVPFEVAGVLLFIVMVGAAHLARPEK